MKCLEIDRDHRLLHGQRNSRGPWPRECPRASGPSRPRWCRRPRLPRPRRLSLYKRYRIWIAAIAAVVLLAALELFSAANIFRLGRRKAHAPVAQASLAILPFRNAIRRRIARLAWPKSRGHAQHRRGPIREPAHDFSRPLASGAFGSANHPRIRIDPAMVAASPSSAAPIRSYGANTQNMATRFASMPHSWI